jgi:hypothetical protein
MNGNWCEERSHKFYGCYKSAGGTIDLIVEGRGISFGHYEQQPSGVPRWVEQYHIAISDAPILIEAITAGVDKYMEVEE